MSTCVNLFALHYFLWFAAIASIYGYVSVYAQHYANSTPSQYGLLNMILPFVTIGSKLLFCSLADRYRAYRSVFVVFLITALIGYGSFAVLPFFVTPQSEPPGAGVNRATFALICLMASVGSISMSVISCLSDAFAVNSARKYGSSYGMIRLWGTIGWGLSALLLAFINESKQLPKLVPGLIMTIVLLVVDIVAAIFWPRQDDFKLDKSASDVSVDDLVSALQRDGSSMRGDAAANRTGNGPQMPTSVVTYGTSSSERLDESMAVTIAARKEITGPRTGQYVDITSFKMQWILFKEVARRRRSILRHMGLFTISGALISLQWSYFFMYLERLYKDEYTYISGISMIGQSMLGELPFFLLSQRVIKTLGRSHTLSISIASIGVRYLLYEYLLPNASMYFVLATETLQGPNFGLFYVVMTEVALDYSDCEEAIVATVQRDIVENNPEQIDKLRQALRATMQSLMSACYEGLGVGIGSITGGLVIDHFGFSNLWFYSALAAFLLGLTNSLIDMSGLSILVDRRSSQLAKV